MLSLGWLSFCLLVYAVMRCRSGGGDPAGPAAGSRRSSDSGSGDEGAGCSDESAGCGDGGGAGCGDGGCSRVSGGGGSADSEDDEGGGGSGADSGDAKPASEGKPAGS